jgi:acid phosphatase family membrane protein YuiD
MDVFITAIIGNRIIVTGAAAWVISQVLKTIIHLITNKRLVLERLMGDGGMPSSHSATVTSVAVASGFVCGWNSPVFAVAFFLAIIVMHDAMGVRQETGKQAKIINNMLVMFENMQDARLDPEQKLKEFVGHTPMQVLAGFGLGLIVAIAMNL